MTSPAQNDQSSAGRLSALDSVRGLAIVLVLTGHYLAERLPDGLFVQSIRPFALGGVSLFFLLSGFLIERQLSRRQDVVHYAFRRLFRILPAYLVCLAVIFVLDRSILASHNWSAHDVIINAVLLQDFFAVPLMSGVFWTLLVEIKFYALAPLIVRAGPIALRCIPVLIIFVNALIFATRGTASTLLIYLEFCFIGMLFGPWSRGEVSGRFIALLVIAAAISSYIFTPYFNLGLAIFVIVNAALLAAALWQPVKVPTLPFLGTISYSWYLYHAAIGYPLMAWIGVSLGGHRILSGLVAIGAAVVVTIAISWVSFTLIEQPGIALGRRMENFVRGRVPRQI